MGIDIGLTMIQGDHLAELPDVFSRFGGIKLTRSPKRSSGWPNTMAAIGWPRLDPSEPNLHKAACLLNGWTIILDPEMDFTSVANDNCAALSQATHSKVFGIICADLEETYAYFISDGDRARQFWVNDARDVAADNGERVPEEPSAAQVDEAFLLELMSRMGLGYSALKNVSDFYVFELDGTAWARSTVR